MKIHFSLIAISLFTSALVACGGGGSGGPPPTPTAHQVTVSWTANREAAVNSSGGGYKVAITGQPVIDVPYTSGTSTTLPSLMSGNYTATVTAYSAINPSTGIPASGVISTSLPTSFSFSVPY